MYKRLAQGYLAFCDAIDRVVDDNPDWRKRERARFVTRHPHERNGAHQYAASAIRRRSSGPTRPAV